MISKIRPISQVMPKGIRLSVAGELDVDKSVKLGPGSAIISEGKCTVKIRNLYLSGGANHNKKPDGQPIHHFADLRAGILKISKNRTNPFVLDALQERVVKGDKIFYPFEVAPGFVLMDNESFCLSPLLTEQTTQFDIGREQLYLARQSNVHPANRLTPPGIYEPGVYADENPFNDICGPLHLTIPESLINHLCRPITLTDLRLNDWPRWLIVNLMDGGSVAMRRKQG